MVAGFVCRQRLEDEMGKGKTEFHQYLWLIGVPLESKALRHNLRFTRILFTTAISNALLYRELGPCC